jgi:hypothetical protein
MVMEEAVDGEMSLSNMVLGFMEDFERDHQRRLENDDDDDEGSSGGDTAESKAFWQTQHSQLHVSAPSIRSVSDCVLLVERSSGEDVPLG